MPAIRSRKLISAVALAMVMAGCSGAGDLPMAPQIPNTGSEIFNIVIDGAPSAIEVGEALTLEVYGEDELGTPVDAVDASWKSSDPSVATVTSTGELKGLKRGSVTITATSKNPPREAVLELDVVGAGEAPEDPGFPDIPSGSGPDGWLPGSGNGQVPPSTGGPAAPQDVGMNVYPETPRVLTGQSLRLMAYQGPSGFEAPAAAIWRSLDPTIATVDEAGVVKGVQAGVVTITATSVAFPGLNTQVRLTVSAPVPPSQVRGISIKPANVVMSVGETFWLLAEVPTWTGGYDPNIRWISADPNIASVTETGQITAHAPGRTSITAIASTYNRGELSATVPVEVRNSSIGRLRLH